MTRDECIAYIDQLANAPEHFENSDAKSFLLALAAWLEDCDGYYRNSGQEIDTNKPSWRLFADALSAATVYE